MVEKKVTDFHKGDHVEFRCRAQVRQTTPLSVVVALDELYELYEISDMQVPPKTLTNLSEPRLTLEEAMELDVDDALVEAVERALSH